MIDLPDEAVRAIGEALIFEAVERLAHVPIASCTMLTITRGAPRYCGSAGMWTPCVDPFGRAQVAYLCPRHGGRVLS